MRQTRGREALYSASDPNDIIRRLDRSDVRKMESTGEAVRICRACGRHNQTAKRFCGAHAKEHDFVLVVTPLFRNTRRSKPTITFREVEANVGAVKLEGEDNLIKLAQQKIKNWPLEFDRLATMVIPREAFA